MHQEAVRLTQIARTELKRGLHTWSGLEGEGDSEVEGLLPEGAGAGAAPGKALSTPCKLTKGQVSMGRKCYRAGQDRAGQGRAGQGRAGNSRITSRKDASS